MNRTYRALGLSACFVLCFSFLVGCGGGSGVTLTGVAVTPASASIAAGATQQFTATGTYSDNSTKDLTSSATWASSSTSVATIAASGLATAVATGSTNITATAAGKTSAAATLTVTAATVVSIAVTPATASIVVLNTQQFTATATYSDKSTKDITSTATWSSATTGVATISAAGLATGAGAGTSAITAASGGVTSSPAATLTVTATAVPVSLVIQDVKSTTPTAPTVSVGSTVPFTVLELYNDGTTHAPSAPATLAWVSATTATATIGAANGIAVAVATGSSVITATETVTAGNLTGNTTLTVVAAAARFAFNADFNNSLTEWSVVPASGAFTAVTPETATGSSQQVLVHPSGHLVYTLNYNGDFVLSTIDSTTGIATPVTNGTFTGAGQPGTAKAAIDPTGRFLYEVFYIPGTSTAAMYSFSIDQTTGALKPVASPTTVFTTPSDILVDNTGNFAYVIDGGSLITQTNGTVFAFQIDQTSGALTPLAAKPSIATGDLTPFFGAIDPANKNLYVANETSISIFAISNGVLSATATTPIGGGMFLESIAITPSGKYIYVSDQGTNATLGSGFGTLFGLTLNTDGSIANPTAPLSYPIGPAVAANPPLTPLPWGVSIDPASTLVTVDINSGSTLAVFNINADGSLTTDTAVPINVPVSSTGGSISTFLTFYTAAAGQ